MGTPAIPEICRRTPRRHCACKSGLSESCDTRNANPPDENNQKTPAMQIDLTILVFICLVLFFLVIFSLPVILFFAVRWVVRRRRETGALRLIEKWTKGM
jgi:hypothetical protein